MSGKPGHLQYQTTADFLPPAFPPARLPFVLISKSLVPVQAYLPTEPANDDLCHVELLHEIVDGERCGSVEGQVLVLQERGWGGFQNKGECWFLG